MLAFAKQEGKEALAVTIFPSYPKFLYFRFNCPPTVCVA